MQDKLYPPSRPQSVGEVLDTTFRIFRVSLLKCLPFSTLSLLAGQLPNMYNLARGRPLPRSLAVQHDPLWWVLYVLGVFAAMILSVAIVRRQCALASGGTASARDELGAALRRVPGFLGFGLLGAIVAVAASMLTMGLFYASQLLAVLWVAILLVLGSWLLVKVSCSGTTYILSERGIFASLGYSWRLTTGSFWRLTAIYTVGLILVFVFYALSGLVAFAVAMPFAVSDLAVMTAIMAVVVVLLGSIGAPFYTAMALAVFGDLSVRLEGSDLAERLASPAAS